MPNGDGTGRLGRGVNCDEKARSDRIRKNKKQNKTLNIKDEEKTEGNK